MYLVTQYLITTRKHLYTMSHLCCDGRQRHLATGGCLFVYFSLFLALITFPPTWDGRPGGSRHKWSEERRAEEAPGPVQSWSSRRSWCVQRGSQYSWTKGFHDCSALWGLPCCSACSPLRQWLLGGFSLVLTDEILVHQLKDGHFQNIFYLGFEDAHL